MWPNKLRISIQQPPMSGMPFGRLAIAQKKPYPENTEPVRQFAKVMGLQSLDTGLITNITVFIQYAGEYLGTMGTGETQDPIEEWQLTFATQLRAQYVQLAMMMGTYQS